MKITYEFVTGEISEVEVDESLGGMLLDLDRQQYNNDHKETRRHVSLDGIFKGCEVTYARGNVLHISQGFGMIRGRFFEVYETEIDVRLADVGETLDGRVYIHLDLSNMRRRKPARHQKTRGGASRSSSSRAGRLR